MTPTGWLLLAVLGAFVAYGVWQAVLGVRDANRKMNYCAECGARFDRYADYPTRIGGVYERHHYCPNDHVKIDGPRSAFGGESTGDRLGGWQP